MLTAAIAKHLDHLELVVYGRSGADCFLEGWRPTPASQVALFAREGTAGAPEGHGVDWPGVQALVRGDKAQHARTSYERAMGLWHALHGIRQTRLDEGGPDEVWLVQLTARTAGPVSLGPDAEGRQQWSVQFDAQTQGPRRT